MIWQPISTAPMDGTTILLITTNPKARYRLCVGKWVERWKAWQSQPGAWTMHPTHWAPLPEGPTP